MKYLLLILICLSIFPLINSTGFAQKKLSVGVDAGIVNNIYRVGVGQGDNLRKRANFNFETSYSFESLVRYSFNEKHEIETGIKFLSKFYEYDFIVSIPEVKLKRALFVEVPIMFLKNLEIDENYNIKYSLGTGFEFTKNEARPINDYKIFYRQNSSIVFTNILMKLGIGIERKIKSDHIIYLGLGFTRGFNKLIDVGVHYKIDNNRTLTTQYWSRGSYINFDFKYNFTFKKW